MRIAIARLFKLFKHFGDRTLCPSGVARDGIFVHRPADGRAEQWPEEVQPDAVPRVADEVRTERPGRVHRRAAERHSSQVDGDKRERDGDQRAAPERLATAGLEDHHDEDGSQHKLHHEGRTLLRRIRRRR